MATRNFRAGMTDLVGNPLPPSKTMRERRWDVWDNGDLKGPQQTLSFTTGTITPTAVAANTVATQTFSSLALGLTLTDTLAAVVPPSLQSGLDIKAVTISAADAIQITWDNKTAGSITPAAGAYGLTVQRPYFVIGGTGVTAAVQPGSSSRGALRLTTASTINSSATVGFSSLLSSLSYMAIELEVRGLRFDIDDISKIAFTAAIFDFSGHHGVSWNQVVSTANMNSRLLAVSDQVKTLNYCVIGNNNGDRSKNLKFRVEPQSYGGSFWDGNEVVNTHYDQSVYSNGNLQPVIQFFTREAVAHWMEFETIILRTWT